MTTEHKPLVLIDGELSQLPANGYIAGLEDDIPQRQEVDFVGTTIVYKGWAALNSTTDQAVWKIQRITFTGVEEDATFEWADDALYSQIWDNRAGLIYS